MYREYDLMKQEYRDGVYYTEIVDSIEWDAIHDIENYTALHRVDFDNPMLLSADNYPMLLNRIKFAKPGSILRLCMRLTRTENTRST